MTDYHDDLDDELFIEMLKKLVEGATGDAQYDLTMCERDMCYIAQALTVLLRTVPDQDMPDEAKRGTWDNLHKLRGFFIEALVSDPE
jgi:hypothetical protein|tara:strand:+ start:1117 stop:1377 length:261 start_codon:yes stop_codon:yes gene_type:complete